MVSFSLTVLGSPVPKGRPRVVKGHAYTPKRTRDYEKLVRDYAALEWHLQEPMDGRLAVTLRYYMASARRADLDNLCKSVLDALQGVVFANDDQVEVLHAERYIDRDNPRAEILVEEL